MKKLLHLAFTLSFIFCISCNNAENAPDQFLKLGSDEFKPTWEEMYTTDLKYYKFALSYWRKISEESITHFPLELKKENTYSFIFVPAILQGGSHLELKIQFSSKDAAVDFFYKSSTNYTVERVNHDSLSYSFDYCFSDRFGADTSYQFQDIDLIRIIDPTWCSGQGDRELGGITSSIYLDEKKNIVFCVATDGSL